MFSIVDIQTDQEADFEEGEEAKDEDEVSNLLGFFDNTPNPGDFGLPYLPPNP